MQRMRTTKNNPWLAGLLAVVTLLAAAPAHTQATVQGGITISPATATLSLAPGQHQQQTSFTITNRYGSPITLHFDFAQAVGTPGVALSAVKQLDITPRDATVDAGSTVTPTLSLTDSPMLAPGSQQVNLTITQTAAAGGNVSVVPSIRIPLVVIKQAGALSRLSASSISKPGFAVQLPKSATFTLHNTGNVITIPHGYISLQDPRGQKVSKSVINTASAALLPGSQAQLAVSVIPLTHAWLPGMYRTVLTYGAGGGAPATTISTRFLYVPLWEILATALLGAFIYCVRQVQIERSLRMRRNTS